MCGGVGECVCEYGCECVYLCVRECNTFRAHTRIVYPVGEHLCTRAREEAALRGPGGPRRAQCAQSTVRDHAVMYKYYSHRSLPVVRATYGVLALFDCNSSPFVCTGYLGGRSANSSERKRREVETCWASSRQRLAHHPKLVASQSNCR